MSRMTAAPTPPAVVQEQGWLIERYLFSELTYWTGGGTDRCYFSPKQKDAIRFAREKDASHVLARMLAGDGRVALHVWSTEAAASEGGAE